jgi:hypothetical protein
MLIHVGNASAIEAQVGPDGQKTFTTLPGERVTTFRIGDDASSVEAASIVIDALPTMMNPLSSPWWIECDVAPVRDILLAHYGLASDTVRPVEWGDGTTTAKKATTPKEEN